MPSDTLKILVIGAHPDDCDIKAGGTAALYRQAGHQVRFISMTNGESGHHQISGAQLADIRREEAKLAGRVIEIEYDVLHHRDGYLQPTTAARDELIGIIRNHQPDLILTHRPNDYHPDHRYTAQLVCDAAYMVTVPPVVPEVAALTYNPVIAYLSDNFQRPYPFSPTIVVDIEPVFDRTVEMLHQHKSQFYEWLAFNHHYAEQLPTEDHARQKWLADWFANYIRPLADRYRDLIVATYGQGRGEQIKFVEAFEICEYGAPLTDELRSRLFPFLP